MERREFFQAAAWSAGALALALPAGTEQERPLHPAIASLESMKDQEPAPISEEERSERRAKAQRLMASAAIHALLIEPGPALSYYAGIGWGRSERLFALLLPQRGEGVFVCPAFERERAESQIGERYRVRVWQEDESPFGLVATTMRDWGYATGTLAVDGSARFFVADALAKVQPVLKVVSGDPVTQWCRGVKTPHEIELMRFANKVTIEAYRAALQTLREGMTQAELGRNVSASFQKLGYNGGALTLFGESSAYPHGLEKPRELEEGQVVLVDGGTSVQGYASDITRTVVFGAPPAEAQQVYDIVKEAQSRALRAARPGAKAGAVDTAAREYIAGRGFGPGYKFFTHRLGHAIGLEGHEWPYLVRGSDVVLRPGMCFSDEPGIYQYGKFGVRLEDIIVITDDGAEMLTPQSSSLGASGI